MIIYNDIKKFLKNNDIILSGFENTSNNHLNPNFHNMKLFKILKKLKEDQIYN